ncbi:MAG: OsmC family protein [Robiginitomaculum sp.]|nr:OsmC family protein [Robiginitomaculum sp.]
MGNQAIVSERAGGIYTQDVAARDHKTYADEPKNLGGSDLGMAPFEFVCAGLGACTNITLRMYAERKGWKVEHMSVDVAYKKSGLGADMKNIFVRKITIKSELDAVQIKRILQIAEKCPVHKMLEATSEIRTELET